jgi:fructose-bisphosphate aldolase class II
MEQIQAVMEVASETRSPVVIQASRGARGYTNDRFLIHLMLAATEVYPDVPVSLHLDHGNEPETCFSAIEQGFTSVMMDGSITRKYLAPARDAMKAVYVERMTQFGQAGHAGDYTPASLAEMRERYAAA